MNPTPLNTARSGAVANPQRVRVAADGSAVQSTTSGDSSPDHS